MLKNRLYYQDAYCRSFSAHILQSAVDAEGRPYLTLDNSAFYPTGGGQPHDRGVIAGVEVLNVEEVEGELRHYLEDPLPEDGRVHCEIDWERRFDHMQQHAGQHILSAAFIKLFNLPTMSFHLGTKLVTIDIDTPDLSSEQVLAVEKWANQVILDNHPIETKWVAESELSNYPLHKKIQAKTDIRLVIIPSIDYNGCGGTHPKTTGEVRAIKILHVEKHRGMMRVTFVCGERTLHQLHHQTAILQQASQLLSAAEDQIPSAIGQLLQNNLHLEKKCKSLTEALIQFEATDLIAEMEPLITRTFQGRSMQELQKLAKQAISSLDQSVVLLFSQNQDSIQFVAGRGAQVSTSMKDVSAVILPMINGRGGGNDAFVQGGGDRKLNVSDIVYAVQNKLSI